MYQDERYGWQEFTGTVLTAILIAGGLSMLAGVTWGWTLGLNIVASGAVGAVLGGVVGGFFGVIPAQQRQRGRRREMGFVFHSLISYPLLLLALLGAAVGVIKSVIFLLL